MQTSQVRRRLSGAVLSVALLAGMAGHARAADAPAGPTSGAVVRPMADMVIAATIKVGTTADWVTIAKDKVWVGSTGPFAVNEIDPATNAVFAVALPGRPCAGLASDDRYVWVPMCGPTPQLARVDQKTRAITGVFPVGPPAGEGGVIVADGNVWLVSDKAGSLVRIDPETGAVKATVALPAGSYNPVFAGGLIWVTHVDGDDVSVVDPKTNAVVDTVKVGPKPRFLAAGGGSVWTLNQGDGTLGRIDVATRRPAPAQPLETPGYGGDVAFEGKRVWTTMMKTPLSASDASTGKPLCQWKGEGGDSLNIGHGAIWLTNLRVGTVSRIPLDRISAECAAK